MNEMTNTHILINRFSYMEPATLDEAIALLVEHGPRAKILAGGTDLLVQMKIERIAPPVVINIGKIPGLEHIAVQDDTLHIGSRTSILAIEQNLHVQAYYPALQDACASFSTTQVQVMGTLGGNLGNASPASDSAPALIACGALIELTGPDGQRLLPLEQFFTGPGRSVLAVGELITGVILQRPEAGTGSAFVKISRVAADIAKTSVAVSLVRDPQDTGRVKECRIAYGSVAPIPFRARQTEAVMAGQFMDDDLAARAAETAMNEVAPISDVRSTESYRRDAVRAITLDAIQTAWRRASLRPGDLWGRSIATVEPDAVVETVQLQAEDRRMIELQINGRMQRVWVAPNDLLLSVIRENLQLTGTKYGCGIGECSACSILMDGKPTLACLVLAIQAVGRDIRTIEGLQSEDGELDPVQEAFIDYAAYQCGYCTPGMIMTARSLLDVNPSPTENDVRHYLRGNICRCTGYANIVRAVLSCAE